MPINLTPAEIERLSRKPCWKGFDTDAPHHRRCDTCNARVTKTKNHGEVGHRLRCPERPAHLPSNGGGSAYYDAPDDPEPTTIVTDGGTAACPRCGEPMAGSTVHGPNTEYASPCGCQIPARGGGRHGD